jgi:hypothetical protein
MSDPDEMKLDYDDNAIDIVDKINAVLASRGIRFDDDGLEHDGFSVLRVIHISSTATE